MTITTRQDALSRGEKYYNTGKPCKNGHNSDRLTSNRSCVACLSEYSKQHYEVNKEEISAARKAKYQEDLEASRAKKRSDAQKRRSANPDAVKSYAASYYQANRDRLLAKDKKNRELRQSQKPPKPPKRTKEEVAQAYRQRNKEKLNQRVIRYARERRQRDPLFLFKHSLRSLISHSFSNKGFSKKSKTAQILGCEFDFLITHIERQFLPGMTWDNRHLWHIDHITPLATATTEEEVLALNHFTNLRPIWKDENLKKRDSITHLI